MSNIQIRPKFKIKHSLKPEEILDKLQEHLDKNNADCKGTILENYAILRIPTDKQHYWSPQLSIDVEQDDNGTSIKGMFGPRPSVWMMFAGFYIFSFFAAIVGLVYGFSQLTLDMTPHGFWIFIFAVILLVVAYSIAYSGQKLGHDQMVLLRSFLEKSLRTDIEINDQA